MIVLEERARRAQYYSNHHLTGLHGLSTQSLHSHQSGQSGMGMGHNRYNANQVGVKLLKYAEEPGGNEKGVESFDQGRGLGLDDEGDPP